MDDRYTIDMQVISGRYETDIWQETDIQQGIGIS